MGLPGVPKTKPAIVAMAKREGWRAEQRTGLGGTRVVYEVPDRYLKGEGLSYEQPHSQDEVSAHDVHPTSGQQPAVAGTVVAGTGKVDIRKLELAMKALNEWEQSRGLTVAQERRPAVVAVLYDYLVKSEGESSDEIAVVLRALG